MGATSSSVGFSDSPSTLQSYARLALAGLLAWLAWGAFRDPYGGVPLVGDIDTASELPKPRVGISIGGRASTNADSGIAGEWPAQLEGDASASFPQR